jgi:two-component system CheB/CheR fusion protein
MKRHWNIPNAEIRESLNRALEVWEAAFDAIVEKSADGVIVVDRGGTICFANSAAESMLGSSTGSLLGKTFGIPVVPGKTSEIDLLKGGGLTRIAEMRTVETSWQGNAAYLATLRDVTERKKAEEQAREAVRRRDEFLAILSHELRNPLAAISNAASVLAGLDIDRETFEKAHQVIERQCGQMTRLLEDLLDVSRVARRKIELRKECLDLTDVITQTAEAMRATVDDAGQTLSVRVGPGPIAVDADPVRLQQILVNLLSNASKYSKSGDRIELSADVAGDEVAIRVRDEGVGLSSEMLDAVFEPFVQLEASLDRSDEGLGLGLAIVYGLVRLHGGSVQASSPGRGKGSEFVVRLPLSKSSPKQRIRPASTGAEPPLRILIIEDNRDVRSMLKTLLERVGHDVDVAADGVQGSEMIEFQRPDLALVDIGLPRLDGYELARRVRTQEDCRDVVLVALTGYSQSGDQAKALASGFDAHLAKPVEFDRLRRMLREIGESKRSRASLDARQRLIADSQELPD